MNYKTCILVPERGRARRKQCIALGECKSTRKEHGARSRWYYGIGWETASDKIYRNMLLEAMTRIGIDTHLVNVTAALYIKIRNFGYRWADTFET